MAFSTNDTEQLNICGFKKKDSKLMSYSKLNLKWIIKCKKCKPTALLPLGKKETGKKIFCPPFV